MPSSLSCRWGVSESGSQVLACAAPCAETTEDRAPVADPAPSPAGTAGLSPAQGQARLLAALAGHLLAHDLPVVDVESCLRRWRLRVAGGDEDLAQLAGFLAWCRSLGVAQVRVFLILGGACRDFAECRASARIAGQEVTVWTAVPGLERWLVEDPSTGPSSTRDGGLRLGVSELAHYAEHRVLPEHTGGGS